MTISKTKKEKLNSIIGKEQADELLKEHEANAEEVAEMVGASAINSLATKRKPNTFKAFQKEVNDVIREAGIIDQPVKKEIQQKIRTTQAYKALLQSKVSLDKITDVLAEGVEANKTLSINKTPVDVPDHPTRLQYIREIKNDYGLDVVEEDKQPLSVNIAVFNPADNTSTDDNNNNTTIDINTDEPKQH
jgi:hypothetical protein